MDFTPNTPLNDGNEWDRGLPPATDTQGIPAGGIPAVEMEPGWAATRALMRVGSDELLAVMLRPSFRPVKDLDLVPVSPCAHCYDGGIRTAGSVRTRKGRELVRACDTCAAVEIGDNPTNPPPPANKRKFEA